MTLAETAAHLEDAHRLRVSQSTVWRFFHGRGVTAKKPAHASEQQRPDVLQRRKAWFEALPRLDPDRLVFVDETGASTKMARRCGRAVRGRHRRRDQSGDPAVRRSKQIDPAQNQRDRHPLTPPRGRAAATGAGVHFVDDHHVIHSLKKEISYQGMRFDHETIIHSTSEYVRDQVHTNGIESFWAILKRGYHGIFHMISPKHLHCCVNEFATRHNMRPQNTETMMIETVARMIGKTLTYRELIANNGLSSGARPPGARN